MSEKALTYVIEKKQYDISKDIEISVDKDTEILFDISNAGYIYGHGFNHNQPYPLNTSEIINDKFEVNNIQSPIWLCSNGYIIYAEMFDSLSVKLNENNNQKLILKSNKSAFKIKVFCDETLTSAHKRFLSSMGERRLIPDDGFLGDSLFCTWTQYPRCINQDRIISFAQEIRKNNYPCSIIIIDDIWEAKYGDLSFSKDFPNPKEMVQQLHSEGFKVILWVTPFINTDSKSFIELSDKKLLVWHKWEDKPSLFKWWGGEAGLIDLTNPAAVKWYEEKLLTLKNDYGIDGFKIDGGDAKYQPNFENSKWHDYKGASGYSELLLSVFERVASGMCETRTAWLSQKRNIIWRQGGKDSHWGADNGLKAVVSLALNMALMGYDFLIPDMVGGRVQTMSTDDPLVTDELFMRFAECSAFMPSIQFSYFPWNYSEDVNTAIRLFANAHKAIEWYIKGLIEDKSSLILRPMWYDNDEDDERLFTINDEYMLGNDLIVAPVLDSGVTKRDVVLPSGNWVDIYTGRTYGTGKIKNVSASCPGIPLFVRKENIRLVESLESILKQLHKGFIGPNTTTASYEIGINRDLKVTG